MADSVSYSFDDIERFPRDQRAYKGQVHGVCITLRPDVFDDISGKIAERFRGDNSAHIVCSNISYKSNVGFVIIEWLEFGIDSLFLRILQDDEAVIDYILYERNIDATFSLWGQ